MKSPNRRIFLAATLATSARPIWGANDRVNVAIVGAGGRGRNHLDEVALQKGARIAAVCDVNQAARERAEAIVLKSQNQKPRLYTDMRHVFDDKEIDAVTVATPNHWHALASIWACMAGKDVYVEKPACHNVWEGFQMIAAARKHSRMVMVGSQGRSNAHKIEAVRLLHEGVIGKVYMAKGMCYKRRKSIGHTPDGPVPPGVDWNLFLGPAQMKPYSLNKFRYNWHWFWDTGNGDIGNQGVHEMDIARWGLGKDTLPMSVFSTGGKFAYTDDQETPNTQTAVYDYGDSQLVFEVRGLLTGAESEMRIGNLFYGSDGWMALAPDGYRIYKGETNEVAADVPKKEPRAWDSTPHFANFIEAVRTRSPRHLTADVETGVLSACLCHLGNISYRVGRKLKFDPNARTFPGQSDANALLTREYRSPYVVPERV